VGWRLLAWALLVMSVMLIVMKRLDGRKLQRYR